MRAMPLSAGSECIPVMNGMQGGEHNVAMGMRLDQLRNSDLNLLVYFVVLVEERSVSRAAKRLRLTQSALSRVLQRLRVLFQDDLLVRVGAVYQATPRGLDILKELGSILPRIDTIISGREFNPFEGEANFRITAADSLSYLYGPMFARLHPTAPDLTFGFLRYSEDRYLELEANGSDLVLDADFKTLTSSLRKELLFEDTVVCAVAKDSPYKQRISLDHYLAAQHVAVNILDERQPTLDIALAKIGGRRDCPFTVPYFGLALRMVAKTHLIATLPKSMSEMLVDRRTIRLIKAPREVETFRYIMVWHKRQERDPAHTWLRGVMREMTVELCSTIRRSAAGPTKNRSYAAS